MGQYLCVGICRKITIDKDELEGPTALEIATIALRHEVDLDLYVKSEDDTSVFWNIKKEIFEDGLLDFLKVQLEIYDASEDYTRLYESIAKAKTYENILALATDNGDEHFQEIGFSWRKVNLGHGQSASIGFNHIVFMLEGKISMECYGGIFDYFEQMIRLQKDKYPIAGTVKVFISD